MRFGDTLSEDQFSGYKFKYIISNPPFGIDWKREQKAVEVQAVGAGAANQAVKAIAIARGYLAPIGIDLICIPAFANIQIDGEERTAIKLICEQR